MQGKCTAVITETGSILCPDLLLSSRLDLQDLHQACPIPIKYIVMHMKCKGSHLFGHAPGYGIPIEHWHLQE